MKCNEVWLWKYISRGDASAENSPSLLRLCFVLVCRKFESLRQIEIEAENKVLNGVLRKLSCNKHYSLIENSLVREFWWEVWFFQVPPFHYPKKISHLLLPLLFVAAVPSTSFTSALFDPPITHISLSFLPYASSTTIISPFSLTT